MRRILPLVLGVALAVVVSAAPASAHATFKQGSVPAGTDAEISMSVPDEESEAHTAEVVVELPDGFEIVSCSVKPGWSCTAVPAAQGTGTEPAPEPVHDDKEGHHAQSAEGPEDHGGKHDGDKHDGDKHDGDKHDGDKHDGDGDEDGDKGDEDEGKEGEGEEAHAKGASVTFNRISDDSVEKVDVFQFTVRAPAATGDYSVPVHQRYSNKKAVEWTPALNVE